MKVSLCLKQKVSRLPIRTRLSFIVNLEEEDPQVGFRGAPERPFHTHFLNRVLGAPDPGSIQKRYRKFREGPS